ncbi:MAG: hypothetical protein ACPGNR_12830, partial [Paracoccaceae bacterium]
CRLPKLEWVLQNAQRKFFRLLQCIVTKPIQTLVLTDLKPVSVTLFLVLRSPRYVEINIVLVFSEIVFVPIRQC